MTKKTLTMKTAVSSTENGTTNGVRQLSATNKSPSTAPSSKKSSSKKPPATGKSAKQRVVTSEQIGKIAGEVWEILADQEEQSLAALKKSVDAPGDMILAAVGWLAREDKLRFTARGRSVRVSLRL